jgi:Na+-translocating ferredoxin:NAD+ oxidoreductase subunit B
MENVDNIYVVLQKHLDKQSSGFPTTKFGVEIRILKQLFNIEQVNLALHLSNQPQSIVDVFNIVKGNGISLEKVTSMLEEMESNGAIRSIERNGNIHYFTAPAAIMAAFHRPKATSQFWADWEEYDNSDEFKRTSASTKISQMRTIPIEKSIRIENHITTYDHIREIIDTTDGPIAVRSCRCRESAGKKGQPCHTTSRLETCLHFGGWARHFIKAGTSREITREEALEIARQNEADGLILQPSNEQKVDFVCSCCGCCCGSLKRLKTLPKPAESWAHNFYAEVETDRCTNCGTCVEKCQMNAAQIDEQNGYSTIDLDRCIGCGICVAACPSEALRLVKKEKETIPPEDVPTLYKILAEQENIST